ncbi:hypothetical protein C2E21_1251 [Chlorella sorokiniana]|uniref:Uncharacterized protein n=1 Tax=Chlorella sorokiniana TaxID=3076 RepID=A0A2P6U2E9_CHLSO|nr:hypothetical protein C2E21_1251 [Chlorella sorokiniana]|eukprot:PRW60484.1 hypothetical protein C2E21_1251 [Chlorella sorokiniana]
MGPAAADLDPLEGHCEPPPADGEGPEWNMGDFTHHDELSRQGKASPSSSQSGGSSSSTSPAPSGGSGAPDMGAGGQAKSVGAVVGEGGAKQDGHYHYTAPGDYGSVDQQKMNESWMCEEEPEALGRSSTAKHEPAHYEMYRGEADDSEGFKEPGQSIASALPGRRGDTGAYSLEGENV